MKKNENKIDLLIYDDIFPLSSSAFRFIEFNYLLKQDNLKTQLYTTGGSLGNISKKNKLKKTLDDYLEIFPQNKGMVEVYRFWRKFNAKLLYIIFLNNTYKIIKKIESNKIPFIFTLYPGGGFYFNNEESDKKLKRVFDSEYFRKVIVTQEKIVDYLLEKKLCKKKDIEYIYGGPFLPENFEENQKNIRKLLYKKDKSTFDVCFVAHRYMPEGVDKGYDIFIEVAKKLLKLHDNFRFHVVGGFSEDDINIDKIKRNINFYGVMNTEEFEKFFSKMELIISPNRPNKFKKGSFDGFPTASCDIAGANKTFVLCSDELSLNKNFEDREDIRIIPINASEISDIVLEYYNNPEVLYRKSSNASKKFIELFCPENQVDKRIAIFKKILNSSKNE